ncbi:uncharacterized protein BDZ83DRAFT_626788 [Colletotrichum acutatum]|uniref:Uncharacterized protein n=1 Tax=Glomerella acutata TaxID=27357 RepID=A0AAD8UK24_GLOAC|nr:uncharacterized protein BDZ83DRAFT_626788 [Colletotrichum acutatum]KAK1723185.1 hypothetical protein BDZ83DRAFT_626788 [Colletotrichum acutatum]
MGDLTSDNRILELVFFPINGFAMPLGFLASPSWLKSRSEAPSPATRAHIVEGKKKVGRDRNAWPTAFYMCCSILKSCRVHCRIFTNHHFCTSLDLSMVRLHSCDRLPNTRGETVPTCGRLDRSEEGSLGVEAGRLRIKFAMLSKQALNDALALLACFKYLIGKWFSFGRWFQWQSTISRRRRVVLPIRVGRQTNSKKTGRHKSSVVDCRHGIYH